MAWIKRNLYFVLGSLVALGLMVFGGFYLYSAISKESEVSDKIQEQYSELDRLNKQNPHPGDPKKTDNVAAAKQQQAQLEAYIKTARGAFQPPRPIPDSPKVLDSDFASQLRITVAQLRKAAEDSSITLPQEYYFTFESQKRMMVFESGSLDKLAVHLGAIKSICDILFAARINALDGIRREKVSETNDTNLPDYLTSTTMVTPLADLTPYEFTFRCFSGELAEVLAAIESSPCGFIVKTVNVEHPAGGPTAQDSMQAAGEMTPVVPQPYPGTIVPGEGREASRYNRFGPSSRYGAAYPTPQPTYAPPPASSRGPAPVVNETQLKVTMMIEVVKLKAAK